MGMLLVERDDLRTYRTPSVLGQDKLHVIDLEIMGVWGFRVF